MPESDLPHFKLTIAGQPLVPELMNDVLECVVENSLHLPDVCTVRIYDAEFKWVDSSPFELGAKVVVEAGYERNFDSRSVDFTPIFYGEVVALEMDMIAMGVPTMVVRCFDKSHRLHRGRHARPFVNIKDSDIATQLAAEAGLVPDVDETEGVHDWLLQNNQTNWEFLSERAGRNGCRLYTQGDGKLYFKKIESDPDEAVTLEWGKDLRSFRPRLSASPQVDQVTVRGWDPKQKQPLVGQVETDKTTPNYGKAEHGGQAASAAYSSAPMFVVDRPVHTQEEAQILAQSVCDDIAGTYLEADGLCYGAQALLPGKQVEIKNIGSRFSGKYRVTATTHTYSPAEGFTTQFVVSGKRAATVLSVLEESHNATRAHLGGNVVVGVVTANNDPDNLGRVQVTYPWLSDDNTSFWVRLVSPMAGPQRGIYFIPEVNDEVLVAFEHGDVTRPYVLGALWNGVDTPIEGNDQAVESSGVVHRIIKTRIGHTILLDDADSTSRIRVNTANNHVLCLDDKNQNITAQTTNGHIVVMDDQNQKINVKTTQGHQVTMDDAGQQIVIVDMTGQNSITIASTDNSISAQCMGNFSVQAQGQVSIQGQLGIQLNTPMQLSMEGDLGVSMQGLTLDMQANTTASLQASAELTIQGGMVMIN